MIDEKMRKLILNKKSCIMPTPNGTKENAAISLLTTCIGKDSSPLEYVNGFVNRTEENPNGELVTDSMAEAVRQAMVYLHAEYDS